MAKHIMEVWLTSNNHNWHAADGVFDSIKFLAFAVCPNFFAEMAR